MTGSSRTLVAVGQRWEARADKAEARIGEAGHPLLVPHLVGALAAAGVEDRQMPDLPLLRRRLLQSSIAYVGGMPFLAKALAAEPLPPTPAQTPGPFYPLAFPADSDNDLVHVAGRPGAASGTVTRISGHVLDRAGRGLAGAQIEIWQCDAHGRYHHVRDGQGGRSVDDGFQGYGRTAADQTGFYRFLTIRPVPYPGRTPHIHFAVSGGGAGRFVTQMYVAGEPDNERDAVLLGVRDPVARARLIVDLRPAPEIGLGALAGTFDIVIGAAG
jgi:protocatechuate 3,4-dioxygenase, beta subunit